MTQLANNSTFAVVSEESELDIETASGELSISLVDGAGDLITAELTSLESRALRDWLVKVIPDA